MKVRIPPGMGDGDTLRLPGKGNPGSAGAPPGDAYLTVRVDSHPVFRREGRDLICDVSVGLARAALGGTVEVSTLTVNATVNLPPGTRSGQKLRLRGRQWDIGPNARKCCRKNSVQCKCALAAWIT